MNEFKCTLQMGGRIRFILGWLPKPNCLPGENHGFNHCAPSAPSTYDPTWQLVQLSFSAKEAPFIPAHITKAGYI